jgi:hypothetical protein
MEGGPMSLLNAGSVVLPLIANQGSSLGRTRLIVGAVAGLVLSAGGAAAASFAQYPAAPYSGARHAPVFSGAFHRYWSFRTVMREGFAKGRLFAGHYVLFGTGCGTDCSSWNVGDLKTGYIYNFPLGGEDYVDLQLEFRAISRLVQASWNTSTDPAQAHCQTEDLVWMGQAFAQGPVRDRAGRCPEGR